MLASTLDEYSRFLCYPFPPFLLLSGWCNQMVDPWSQMPPPMDDATWIPLTIRSSLESPRQEALPLRSYCFCASLLKASLFNLCLYSDIVASANSCVSSYVFEPSRPLACNIKLVLFWLCLELCCDIFPWAPDLDRTNLRVWLVYGRIRGVTFYQTRRRHYSAELPMCWTWRNPEFY